MVVLQAVATAALGVRIAAPVIAPGDGRMRHPLLAVPVSLGEGERVVALPLLAAVPVGEFADRVGNLAHLRDALVRGVDLLFAGA